MLGTECRLWSFAIVDEGAPFGVLPVPGDLSTSPSLVSGYPRGWDGSVRARFEPLSEKVPIEVSSGSTLAPTAISSGISVSTVECQFASIGSSDMWFVGDDCVDIIGGDDVLEESGKPPSIFLDGVSWDSCFFAGSVCCFSVFCSLG